MTTTARLTGYDAIAYAEAHGLTLSKYTDPVEEARDGLTVTEAREIAAEDPSLIYVDPLPDGTVRYTVSDGVEGYTVDATSPREAVERYLETYDWRRDLDAEYGDRGLTINGSVAIGERPIANFRATPDGIARFIEF